MTAAFKVFLVLSAVTLSTSAQAACMDTVFRDGFEDLANNFYEVELVVSDLGSRSASFQLNGNEVLNVTADGTYCFAEQVQGGEPYQVVITEQPATGPVCASDALTGTATSRISIPIACTSDRTEWDNFNWDEANWN